MLGVRVQCNLQDRPALLASDQSGPQVLGMHWLLCEREMAAQQKRSAALGKDDEAADSEEQKKNLIILAIHCDLVLVLHGGWLGLSVVV